MPEDLSRLFGQIAKGTKGGIAIRALSDVRTAYHIRRPTGIMDLDEKMGGGWICGTVNQIFGPEGAGKNLLCSMTIAQCQRDLGDAANIVVVSFGYSWDLDLMRKAGCKVRYTDTELEQQGIDPATATPAQRGHTEGNLHVVCVTEKGESAPAEQQLDAVLQMVSSRRIHLIVIDEMASGETEDEVKKGLDENARMASWASLVSSFIKKLYSALRQTDEDGAPNETCLIGIQPVRANTDPNSAKFNPYTQPSGHAFKHAKSLDLHIKPVGQLRRGDAVVGKKIQVKIAKGKFGVSEGAVVELEFFFFTPDGGGGFDTLLSLVSTAEAYGCITRRGANYTILDFDEKIKGREALIDYLRQTPAMVDELSKATRAAIAAGDGEVK